MKSNTGKTILIYFIAVIVITSIISPFSVYHLSPKRQSAGRTAVFILDEDALESIYKDKVLNLDSAEMKTYAELRDEIYSEAAMNEILLAAMICVGIGIATLILYHVIKKQKTKDLLAFVEVICSVNESTVPSNGDNLRELYEQLEKHFEENLKSYKKLNAYITHEQKNALFLLRARLEYDGHHEYLKQLDDIATSIEDILTISDTEDEKAMEETDCILICAELCDKYEKLNHPIDFSFDEDDCLILAKPRWIERAIGNLLDNAVKYGKGQPIELSISRKYGNIIITVADQGCGISKDEQKKIFHNRYRVKDLNKDGYGIGLSLVTHVCDLCGGFVWVESAPERGSTFYLSFPAIQNV